MCGRCFVLVAWRQRRGNGASLASVFERSSAHDRLIAAADSEDCPDDHDDRPGAPPRAAREPGRWIAEWHPEDAGFWARAGARVARRNLVFSIFSEHIGFSVWSLWSVFVLFLTPAYGISPDPKTAAAEKFLLTTLPTALGAGVRAALHARGRQVRRPQLDRASARPCCSSHGGRRDRAQARRLATARCSLLAALAGVGGGNFASSMANINSFYPQRLQGPGARASTPAAATSAWPSSSSRAWPCSPPQARGIPRVMLGDLHPAHRDRRAVRGAVHGQHRARAQREARHADWPAVTRTPGSSRSSTSARSARSSASASPSARCCRTSSARTSSPPGKVDPVKVAYLTFLGPLVGSLIRPVGGWLADRFGGARTTFWNFVAHGGGRGRRARRVPVSGRSRCSTSGSSRCSSCPASATARRTR